MSPPHSLSSVTQLVPANHRPPRRLFSDVITNQLPPCGQASSLLSPAARSASGSVRVLSPRSSAIHASLLRALLPATCRALNPSQHVTPTLSSNRLLPRQPRQALSANHLQTRQQRRKLANPVLPRKRSANTISAIPLNSVEVKDEEYMSDYEESEGELEVSQSESEIVMAQTYEEEAEKEIEVTLTRPEELKQESKDDQSFVLVNPPTLPYIFDDFDMEMDVKERSKTFCTADTFVLDDLIIIDSYVLEVPDKLPFLNKGVFVSLPNAKGKSIILGYSLLEGIT
ncbi:hypothetical protein Sjap_022247 [Stephania japonica]|uniref:Uncharacterized protein n=1 Tax=Stephania japonica TaxID=461633 RepID=A0AAP0HUV7_9MAGN